MKVRFSPQALRRMKVVGTWWRKNRRATQLFDDELERAVEKIQNDPLLGVVHEILGGKTFRRIRLPKTKQNVFYVVDDANGIIVIHNIWGARRGPKPKL